MGGNGGRGGIRLPATAKNSPASSAAVGRRGKGPGEAGRTQHVAEMIGQSRTVQKFSRESPIVRAASSVGGSRAFLEASPQPSVAGGGGVDKVLGGVFFGIVSCSGRLENGEGILRKAGGVSAEVGAGRVGVLGLLVRLGRAVLEGRGGVLG